MSASLLFFQLEEMSQMMTKKDHLIYYFTLQKHFWQTLYLWMTILIFFYELDLRKNVFTVRLIKHQSRLPKVVMESLSLEVFKRCVVVVLMDVILW